MYVCDPPLPGHLSSLSFPGALMAHAPRRPVVEIEQVCMSHAHHCNGCTVCVRPVGSAHVLCCALRVGRCRPRCLPWVARAQQHAATLAPLLSWVACFLTHACYLIYSLHRWHVFIIKTRRVKLQIVK